MPSESEGSFIQPQTKLEFDKVPISLTQTKKKNQMNPEKNVTEFVLQSVKHCYKNLEVFKILL